MTYGPGAPGSYGRPALDTAASAVIASARQRFGPRHAYAAPQPRPLTESERKEALETIAQGGACRCCGGLHAGDELACPRLATFELDGDGRLKGGSYWPDGTYDTARILYAEDAAENEAGDGQS